MLPPPSTYNSSCPDTQWEGVSLWTGVCPPPPQLCCQPPEKKQTFLCIRLASFWFLSDEQPDPTFGNALTFQSARHSCCFCLSPPSHPSRGPTSTRQCASFCPPESSLPRASIHALQFCPTWSFPNHLTTLLWTPPHSLKGNIICAPPCTDSLTLTLGSSLWAQDVLISTIPTNFYLYPSPLSSPPTPPPPAIEALI